MERHWVLCLQWLVGVLVGAVCCRMSEMSCAVQFVLLFSCVEGVHVEYDGYQFPAWAEGIGWLVAGAMISLIPVWAVVTVYRSVGSWQALTWLLRAPSAAVALNLRDVITPTDEWGPALQCNRPGPHHSVRSFYWLYAVGRVLCPWTRRRLQAPESSAAVAYHEGHCFVTESSFYHQSTDESHMWCRAPALLLLWLIKLNMSPVIIPFLTDVDIKVLGITRDLMCLVWSLIWWYQLLRY